MGNKKLIGATALLAAAAMSGGSPAFKFGFHSGGKINQQFDFGSIMKARKLSRRNKNQMRLRGIGLK